VLQRLKLKYFFQTTSRSRSHVTLHQNLIVIFILLSFQSSFFMHQRTVLCTHRTHGSAAHRSARRTEKNENENEMNKAKARERTKHSEVLKTSPSGPKHRH